MIIVVHQQGTDLLADLSGLLGKYFRAIQSQRRDCKTLGANKTHGLEMLGAIQSQGDLHVEVTTSIWFAQCSISAAVDTMRVGAKLLASLESISRCNPSI